MRRLPCVPGVARRDDALASQRLAGELADDPSLRHDKHAVAQVRQLLRVGGYDQHRHALARQVADEPMDLGPRADVDAARGLVENEHFRLRLQPTSDDDLLLIAAAQPPDRRLGAGVFDREVADGALGERLAAAAADEAAESG